MSKDPDEWIGVAQVAGEMGYSPRQAWEYVRKIGVAATNAARMELARFRRADFEEARKRSQTPITPRARTGAAVGTHRASSAATEGATATSPSRAADLASKFARLRGPNP